MSVERKVSTGKYFVAFVLTIVVFAAGVVVGIILESARLADAEQITLEEKVNLRSLQLQQNYIESGIADCNAFNQILEANINELTRKMEIVNEYEQNAVFNEEKFQLQLRDYFLTEVQFLLVSQEIDKKCTKDNLKILYFYDENRFDTQGDVLDYVRKVFDGKVLVFSFNSAFEKEPLIKTLLTSYNITQFPSVVVENKVFQGSTPVEVLLDTVCRDFASWGKEVPAECTP
ncbi:hypothetical protein HYU22_02310 [Candidatus Woesearchaeota archaeon]|nr:hypothetical protein [Candidatus Woesearchaeota archaeon]